MIPYEDLVAALSHWRAGQGLPSGPADHLGDSPSTRYDYSAPLTQMAGDSDVVEVGEELIEDEPLAYDGGYQDDYHEADGYGEADSYATSGRAETDVAALGDGPMSASDATASDLETVELVGPIGEPPPVQDYDDLPPASYDDSEATSLNYSAGTLSPNDDTQDSPLLAGEPPEGEDIPMFDDGGDSDPVAAADGDILAEEAAPSEGGDADVTNDSDTADFRKQ